MARYKKPVEGVMFDLDGTLILSDRTLGNYQVLPGAADTLDALDKRAIPWVILTNGSAYPPPEQAAKLRDLGLPVDDTRLLTPSSVAAELMVRNRVRTVLVLGTPGVGYCLDEHGIDIRFTGEKGAADVDAVYIGWHPDCGMKDIEAASNAIWNGARLYVASNVPFFASATGRTPGTSFVITAAVRALTNAPMILTGKPSVDALRFVSRKIGVPMTRIAVVGDDPLVEIIMARRAGAQAFAVTTGFNKESDWAKQMGLRRPHHLLKGVGDLLSYLP